MRAWSAGLFIVAAVSSTALGGLKYEAVEIPKSEGITSIEPSLAEMSDSLGGWGYADGSYHLGYYKNGGWTVAAMNGSPQNVSSNGYITGRGAGGGAPAKGWRVNDGMIESRTLPLPGSAGSGYGVNNYGLMVGYYEASNIENNAFVYDWQTGAVTTIPDLTIDGTPAGVMLARAVNDDGTVVGIARESGYAAWVWTEADGISELGINAFSPVDVWDISQNGYIAGTRKNEIVFIARADETGYSNTHMPFHDTGGVNDAGWVASGNHLYHEGQVDNVYDLLVPGTSYSSLEITDINNRGVMQATGYGSSGYTHLLLRPVAGENNVPNPDFGTTDGLSYVGDVTVVSDPLDAGNSCLQMTTASPVYVDQQVDTPNGSFEIAFDYRFLDAGGTLTVELNGVELELIGPSTQADPDWVNYGFLVADETLYDLDDVTLRITLDHDEAGKQILLDNLQLRVINEIPEPATLALLAAGGLGVFLKRKRS